MNKLPTHSGFTLIELMIAVSIVGILAAIALPSYNDSLMKSRRADAKTALLELANAMERHFTVNNTYCGAAAGGCTGSPTIYTPQHEQFYSIDINSASSSQYSLTATPVQSSSQKDDVCGTLSINQAGVKTSNGTGENCW